MAIQTLEGVYLPRYPINPSGTFQLASGMTMNSTSDKAAFVFQIHMTGDITHIEFFEQNTGSNGNILSVRLETVDSSGNPSGTLVGTNTSGSVTLNNADDNIWVAVPLTAAASVTEGQWVAVVFQLTNAVGSVQPVSNFGDDRSGGSYYLTNEEGAGWTKDTSGRAPIVAVRYSGGAYCSTTGVWAASSVTSLTYNNASAVREVALRFKLPIKMRFSGIWAYLDFDADFDAVLYDSDGTSVLSQLSLDSDYDTTTAHAIYIFNMPSVELEANTFYRLSLKPTSGSSITAEYFTTPSAALMAANPCGADFHMSTHNGTSWTDIATSRPLIGMHMSGFESGGGRPEAFFLNEVAG